MTHLKNAIPFTSVDTEKEAIGLMVRFGRLSYDNKTYTVAGHSYWHGRIDDIDGLTELFESKQKVRA